MANRRLALLIDCDNLAPRYIEQIFDKAKQYGEFTFKRAYGDWSQSRLKSWKSVLQQFAITPVLQFSVKCKNSTDIALVINAMDIMYMCAGHNLDGFCICSSDRDYVPLVTRVKEHGLFVIGFGIQEVPSSDMAHYYNHFIYLDNTQKANSEPKNCIDKENIVKLKLLKKAYCQALRKLPDSSKGVSLSQFGNILKNMDVNYKKDGVKQLNKFISDTGLFSIEGEGIQMRAVLLNPESV